MIYKKLILIFAIILYSSFIYAQQYRVGSIIQDFSLPDVSGKTISLSGHKNAKGFIIVFTSNTCPFSKLYEERLNKLNQKYENAGFPVIAINANDPVTQPEEAFENMKRRAKENQFQFLYLFDPGQNITSLFYPLRTPHAFIVFKDGHNYKLIYSGAIDDSPSDPTLTKVKHIENAIDEILAGKKVQLITSKPIGCTVKWKKE